MKLIMIIKKKEKMKLGILNYFINSCKMEKLPSDTDSDYEEDENY